MDKKTLYTIYGIAGVAALAVITLFTLRALKQKSGSDTIPEILPSPEVEPLPEQTFPDTVMTRSGTRLRSGSSTSSSILKTYNAGYVMKVNGTAQGSDGVWYSVEDPETKQTGFMRSDVVDIP
jgi:hypothetical protein